MSDEPPHFTDEPEPEPEPQPERPRREVPAEPAPEAARALPPLAEGSVRYVLLSPVKAPGRKGMEEITHVDCREPNGTDMLTVGNPVLFDPSNGRITHDMDKMAAMVFRLSNITPPSLGQMKTQDLTGLFWSITHFFLPPVGAI